MVDLRCLVTIVIFHSYVTLPKGSKSSTDGLVSAFYGLVNYCSARKPGHVLFSLESRLQIGDFARFSIATSDKSVHNTREIRQIWGHKTFQHAAIHFEA